MDSDQEEFEAGNAGSADTTPAQWGAVKKGGYAMLKGHPCKVIDYSTAKPGKHGSAKASVVGTDIFTNKKYEDGGPTAGGCYIPIVNKVEYDLIDINEDGYCSLMLKDGGLKEDLKLSEAEDDQEIVNEVRKCFDSGEHTLVTVISACGREKIISGRSQ